MGQYYLIVNIDKKEYIHPHRFNDGLKLREFGCSSEGTLFGLAVLLASGNNQGGGDVYSNSHPIGSWAGDRIVVAGDYAPNEKHVDPNDITPELLAKAEEDYEEKMKPEDFNLYRVATYSYKDISYDIINSIQDADCDIRSDKNRESV